MSVTAVQKLRLYAKPTVSVLVRTFQTAMQMHFTRVWAISLPDHLKMILVYFILVISQFHIYQSAVWDSYIWNIFPEILIRWRLLKILLPVPNSGNKLRGEISLTPVIFLFTRSAQNLLLHVCKAGRCNLPEVHHLRKCIRRLYIQSLSFLLSLVLVLHSSDSRCSS